MKMIVYDDKWNIRKCITGTYDNGQFKWKEGKTLGMGGKEKTAPIVYNKTVNGISIGGKKINERVAFAMWDGKDYRQTNFNELGTIDPKQSFSDFQREFKILDTTKKRALTQPKNNLKDILELIFVIFVIISTISIYYEVHNLHNTVTPIVTTLNKTLNNLVPYIHSQGNLTQALITRLLNTPSSSGLP